MAVATRYPLSLCVLVALLGSQPVTAQAVGDCASGTATAVLDANEVQARLFNTGSLFYGSDGEEGYSAAYEVGGGSPIYAAGLWVGGKVDDELRVAAARYTDFEFWPGPLGEDGAPPADCSSYDRIWTVSREDVGRYLETGEATDDLREWPVELGAPVLDGDGVAGNYNLDGGDQPALRGLETAFWVMNDAGNTHDETLSDPISLEVRVEAIAPEASGPSRASLGTATLYRYRLRYRGEEPLDSAYVSLFVDPDLGYASDDYVGSDTLREMGFVYNADNYDENHYGTSPPVVGFVVVRGPVGLANGRDDDGNGAVDEAGERLGMTAFNYFRNSGPPELTDPRPAEEVYAVMQGLAPNGNMFTAYDNGVTGQGEPTVFAFSGDPVTSEFWSEINAGDGPTAPGDRRFNVSTGPFRLEPGQEETVVFAIVYGRAGTAITDGHLHSITALRQAAEVVSFDYGLGLLEPAPVVLPVPQPEVPIEPEAPSAYELEGPFPNPFRRRAHFELGVTEAAVHVRLVLYDVLGREVARYVDGVPAPGRHPFEIDGSALAPGLYMLRLDVGGQSETLRVVHIE